MAILVVVCIAIVFYILLQNLPAVLGWLSWFLQIFSPFFIGIAIAYLLDIPVRFFARTLFKKQKRSRILSIILTYAVALGLVVLLVVSIIPQLADSISALVTNLPRYLANLRDLAGTLTEMMHLDEGALDGIIVSYSDLINWVGNWIKGAAPDIVDWTVRFGSGIISGLTALIASIYMLASKSKLLGQIKKIVYAAIPKRGADEIYRIADISNRVFAGFISGKVIDSVMVGIINWIFMFIVDQFFLDMPYALLISVLVGVTNIIPFFGPFIGAIPSALILLMVNPWSALVFIIFTLVLQQVEGNIISPKILGDSVGLPALWVLIAIIVGGGVGGFAGMLWGVPVAAVLYTLISDVVAHRLKKKNLDDQSRADAADAPAAGEADDTHPPPEEEAAGEKEPAARETGAGPES